MNRDLIFLDALEYSIYYLPIPLPWPEDTLLSDDQLKSFLYLFIICWILLPSYSISSKERRELGCFEESSDFCRNEGALELSFAGKLKWLICSLAAQDSAKQLQIILNFIPVKKNPKHFHLQELGG